MKKVLSLIFAIAATLVLFLAVLYNPNASNLIVTETIANSSKIEQNFITASTFIDTFQINNGRLPDEAEFTTWAKLRDSSGYSPRDMFIEADLDLITSHLSNLDGLRFKDFGAPPNGSYIIGMWRGEWHEYYISWKRDTTLELDPKTYYLFGSAIRDFIFLIFLFLIFAATSIWLWLSSKKGLKAIHNE